MQLSDFCLQFLRLFEKFRASAYPDAVGKPTIGYGHLILPGETFSSPITLAQGEDLLRTDAGGAAAVVSLHTEELDLRQCESEALVSLVFNAGPSALVSAAGTRSTLMRLLLAGDRKLAAHEFRRWHYAGGKPLGGLLRRRIAEELWFLGGHPRSVIDIATEGWKKTSLSA